MLKKLPVLLGLACLGLTEVYMLAVHAPERVRAGAGAHPSRVPEFGTGTPIAQTFAATADGVEEIRFLTDAAAATHGDLAWALSEDAGGTSAPVLGTHRPLQIERGLRWQSLHFPAVEHSAGRTYRIELRFHPADTTVVALAASLDDTYRGGALTVGREERWGNLTFEARAAADTVAGRFIVHTAPSLAGPLADPRAWTLVLAALTLAMGLFTGAAAAPAASSLQNLAKPQRLVGAACVLALVAAFAATVAARPRPPAVDLLGELYAARFEPGPSGLHWSFHLTDTNIAGAIQTALYAHARSRVAWTVAVPPGAHLRASLGIEPGAWQFPAGDGVFFRVTLADRGGVETDLLARAVDPVHDAADRRWIPVDVDLSRWAGQTVDLRLTTEPSRPGAPVNGAYDWALWAAPRIDTR
jgi:hypothetical protein